MLQWIRRSFRERSVAASIPSRSATPVPKLSIATSADLASAWTISRPFSDFMSTAMLRLLRLALRKTVPRPGAGNGGQPRVSSPCPTASPLMMSAPRSPRYWAHSGPAKTFDRSRTRMPVRGFDTAVLSMVAPQARICSRWRQSGALFDGGKGACHVGWKAIFRDQQIVRRAALIFGEAGPPLVCYAICARQPLAQRAFALGDRLRLQPELRLCNDAIERRCIVLPVKAGAGERSCKRCICSGPQRLGYRRDGLFDGRRNASRLAQTIMIEPAKKQRPDHVARLTPLDEFCEYLRL